MAPLSFPRPSAALLATDTPGSVLRRSLGQAGFMYAYTAFGHLTPGGTGLMMLGFNGQYRDPLTGNYQLGNGYRSYNPVLMRFLSADSLSPFSHGGINAYAYCKNNPVNQTDPSGAAPGFFTRIREIFNSWYEFRAWRDLPAIDNPGPRASLAPASTTTASTVSQTPHPPSTNSPAVIQATRQLLVTNGRFEAIGTQPPRRVPVARVSPMRRHAPNVGSPNFSTHSPAPSPSLSRSSSFRSVDSFDEWSENPVEVARRENEGIANAIRTASS
ncbi:RHS repeat-associated core domain-containing protein [Pseudomonas sp. zfem004]|uniref:RHS repeat-associated core domain-containing protein n=1 Tax=Pseudomonas sp. zfem004 TaxID=3078199 RepID=UPI0039776DDA